MGLPNRYKLEPFLFHTLPKIGHVEYRDAMPPVDQLAAERAKRMEMAGHGGSNDAKMQNDFYPQSALTAQPAHALSIKCHQRMNQATAGHLLIIGAHGKRTG